MKNMALRMMLFLSPLLLGLPLSAGPLAAQAWDRAYEQRAQEAVAALMLVNGLSGWVPNTPEAWPEPTAFQAEIKTTRPTAGVIWDRAVQPARLLRLILSNQNLQRTADLSGLGSLTHLDLSGNQLRGLKLDGDSSLESLLAVKNQLRDLRLDGCPRLTHLSVSANQLETLDLSSNPGLRELSVSMNQLSEIDLSRNPELANFEAMNNKLREVSLKHNPALTRLALSYNLLTELNLAFNPHLSELGLRDNNLGSLDLSHNPELTELAASRNQLTELNLSQAPRLTTLVVDNNQLTRLDLSLAPGLTRLEAQRNPLTEIVLGGNQLENLVSLNLDGCRLPLSQLAALTGQARNRARFGDQEPVLFEYMELRVGQALDLSAEAFIDSLETEFMPLTEKKRRVRPDDYDQSGGRFVFKKPGHYLVRMTNEAVYSSEKNETTGRSRSLKTKVYTGLINVLPPDEPSTNGDL